MNKKINIIDSGMGAYNLKAHLIDIGGNKYDKMVDIHLIPSYVGDLKNNEIKKVFYESIRGNDFKAKTIYMACNSLNSVMPNFKGVFIELIKYIKNNKDKKLLILCTNTTQRELNKFGFKNITIMNLDNTVVKMIDTGQIPNISLKTDLFEEIVLGCTHYDLININTNLNIISTSKLGAISLLNNLKELEGL